MTTARPDPADDEDFVIPDEEDIFLEEMGLGSDGEPITLADPAWKIEIVVTAAQVPG